jgi:hypothetical protein
VPYLPNEFGVMPRFLWTMEAPPHDQVVGTINSAKFNFKLDYQLDSDVVLDYLGARPNSNQIDKKEGFFAPGIPFEQRHHDVDAAWVARNCQSSNNREQVVQALMDAGVKVHSLGQCMHNKDFPTANPDSWQKAVSFLSHYKFYLSFENCICRHYFTEKLFRCYEAGVIPILLGHPADVEYFLPHPVGSTVIMT